MIPETLLSAVVGVSTAVVILYLVRRDHLHTRYALWWIPLATVIAVLGVFPHLIDWIAPKLGIHYSPVIPLLGGVVLLTIKVLLMDIERSRNEVKLHRLIQRVAMLEAEMQAIKSSSQSCEMHSSDSR